MWHKAPCSRKRDEDGDEDGDVDEDDHRGDGSLGGTPAPSKERGREPPSLFFFLDLPLDWRWVSPLVHGLHGSGGAGAPPRLDLSLCFLLFLRS